MTNWRKLVPTFFVFAIVALCLPVVASAQYGGYGGYGGYGQNGGYGGYGNNGRYGNNNYDRGLRDAIRRVEDRSGDFKKHLDRALDHSRLNGSNREDQINRLADQFHDAADDLKDNFGNGRNGRNGGRAQSDAQRLVQLGWQIDRVIGRARLDSRSQSDWNQIRNDLSFIANSFGIDNRGYGNGGYGNGGYGNGGYGNGRDRDRDWDRDRDRDRNRNGGSRWP